MIDLIHEGVMVDVDRSRDGRAQTRHLPRARLPLPIFGIVRRNGRLDEHRPQIPGCLGNTLKNSANKANQGIEVYYLSPNTFLYSTCPRRREISCFGLAGDFDTLSQTRRDPGLIADLEVSGHVLKMFGGNWMITREFPVFPLSLCMSLTTVIHYRNICFHQESG